jgi:hypothetical protein
MAKIGWQAEGCNDGENVNMGLRQTIVTWWLERRARTSTHPDVVYHAAGILSTIDHPKASKAIWGLLHSKEMKRLTAVVSAIIDHTDGDPLETLFAYNLWAMKDEKIWRAIIGLGEEGRSLVQNGLDHDDVNIQRAVDRAVQSASRDSSH